MCLETVAEQKLTHWAKFARFCTMNSRAWGIIGKSMFLCTLMCLETIAGEIVHWVDFASFCTITSRAWENTGDYLKIDVLVYLNVFEQLRELFL